MATTDEGAFEALQRFAAVWHSKYADANGGENRKPPSLTMRAGGVAAVLTEPQLRAVLAENERLRQELERLIPRTVVCPVCQRPTKLTATGLFRHHGPHSRPCRTSGTHPTVDAVAAPQRPVQSEGGPDV